MKIVIGGASGVGKSMVGYLTLGNNDIVVVAGDGSNDFEMLNPLEYFDKSFSYSPVPFTM